MKAPTALASTSPLLAGRAQAAPDQAQYPANAASSHGRVPCAAVPRGRHGDQPRPRARCSTAPPPNRRRQCRRQRLCAMASASPPTPPRRGHALQLHGGYGYPRISARAPAARPARAPHPEGTNGHAPDRLAPPARIGRNCDERVGPRSRRRRAPHRHRYAQCAGDAQRTAAGNGRCAVRAARRPPRTPASLVLLRGRAKRRSRRRRPARALRRDARAGVGEVPA